TSTADSGSGTLRGCLATAADGDTIDATGVSGTILLISGELQIIHNVTINGPGAASLAVNGNAIFRVFENFGSTVTISGLTVTNSTVTGNSANNGGGIFYNGGGTLTVINSIISGNSASTGGGMGSGLQGTTIATVRDSTVSGNSASSNGGGIFNYPQTLTVI